MKYTFKELHNKVQQIESFLNNDELILNIRLIYKLKKFKKKLQEEIDIIKEEIPENIPEIQEYQEKMVQSYVEAGATPHQENGQISVEFDDPDLDKEKLKKKLGELQKEYKEVIEKQNEVYKKQQEILDTPMAEVELPELSIDMFPKEVKANAIPDFIFDMM